MLKKVLLIILSIGFGTIAFAGNFQDLDYLFYKYKIRYTIEKLEKLKKLYPKNSNQYKILQKTENYFMKKMPIDAYGTYARIKLHNIIDNKISEKKKKQPSILSAEVDLNTVYLQKQQKKEKIKQQNKTLSTADRLKTIMSNPNNLTPEQLSSILKSMENRK